MFTETMKKISLDEAVAICEKNGFTAIDNHSSDKSARPIAGIGLTAGGDLFTIFNSRYFSINELYTTDGETLHISTCSIGGVIKPMDTGMDQAKAIEAYNSDLEEYMNSLDEMFPEDAPHRSSRKVAAYHLFQN